MENKSKESQLQSNDKKEKIVPFSAFPIVRKILLPNSSGFNIPQEYIEDNCTYCVPSLSYYDKDEKCIMIPLYTAYYTKMGYHKEKLYKLGIPREVIMDCIRDNE